MKLTRRSAAADVLVEEPVEVVAGKGRPTPKRRETAPKRGPVSAPRTRKEAAQRQRQQVRENRAKPSPAKDMSASQYRAALRSGDPSVLPARDRGPVRKLARDYVDTHRMASNYLLVLFPLMIAAYAIPAANAIVLVVFIGFLVEWFFTGRRIAALARSRGLEVKTGTWSIAFYAGSRAYLPRRFRVPKPQLGIGDAF